MSGDGTRRVLVFALGRERFGVDLSAVDEVIDGPEVHAVPDADPAVLGVAAVRGALVTVYDPRSALGVDDGSGMSGVGAALLATHRGERVGLAVTDVLDTTALDVGEVRAVPGTDAGDGLLAGVVRRENSLMSMLHLSALFDALGAAARGDGRDA